MRSTTVGKPVVSTKTLGSQSCSAMASDSSSSDMRSLSARRRSALTICKG